MNITKEASLILLSWSNYQALIMAKDLILGSYLLYPYECFTEFINQDKLS